MAEKKRSVIRPNRFDEEAMWFVVRYDDTKELSFVFKASEIQDEETGLTGVEKSFDIGSACLAPWKNEGVFPATLVLKNEDKNLCLKEKDKMLKQEKSLLKTKTTNKAVEVETNKKTTTKVNKNTTNTTGTKVNNKNKSKTSSSTKTKQIISESEEEKGKKRAKENKKQLAESRIESAKMGAADFINTVFSQHAPVVSNSDNISTSSVVSPNLTSNMSTSVPPAAVPTSVPSSVISTSTIVIDSAIPSASHSASSNIPVTTIPSTLLATSRASVSSCVSSVSLSSAATPSSSTFAPVYTNLTSTPSANTAVSSGTRREIFPSLAAVNSVLYPQFQNEGSLAVEHSDVYDASTSCDSSISADASFSHTNFLTNDCANCSILLQQNGDLQQQLDSIKQDYQHIQEKYMAIEREVQQLKTDHTNTGVQAATHYEPLKGIKVKKADFIYLDDKDQMPPTGYFLFGGKGSTICVHQRWHSLMVHKTKGKSPSCALKKYMDAFFNPWDLQGLNSTNIEVLPKQQKEIFLSLRLFSERTWNMSESTFNKCIYSKAGTAKRTMHNSFPDEALPKKNKPQKKSKVN